MQTYKTFPGQEVEYYVAKLAREKLREDYSRDEERLKVIQSKIAKFDEVVELMQAALEGSGHKKLSDIIMRKIEELK